MNRFSRTLRRLGFITLMLLAAIAVGITGSAPVLPRNRERHIEIELVETKEEQPGNVLWQEFIKKN